MPEAPAKAHHSDKSREGITWQKLTQPFRLLRPKNNHAIAKVEKFSEIDLGAIGAHFNKKIRAVILDVDDCIAPHHGNILPENLAQIRDWVAADIKVIVFSNMKKTDRYEELEAMGIHVHTGKFAKPDPRGFEACLEKLGTTAAETVMIGDNFITDGGAVRAGIDFIKVAPLTDSTHKPSLKRKIQVASRSIFEKISDISDRITKRKVWRA